MNIGNSNDNENKESEPGKYLKLDLKLKTLIKIIKSLT